MSALEFTEQWGMIDVIGGWCQLKAVSGMVSMVAGFNLHTILFVRLISHDKAVWKLRLTSIFLISRNLFAGILIWLLELTGGHDGGGQKAWIVWLLSIDRLPSLELERCRWTCFHYDCFIRLAWVKHFLFFSLDALAIAAGLGPLDCQCRDGFVIFGILVTNGDLLKWTSLQVGRNWGLLDMVTTGNKKRVVGFVPCCCNTVGSWDLASDGQSLLSVSAAAVAADLTHYSVLCLTIKLWLGVVGMKRCSWAWTMGYACR